MAASEHVSIRAALVKRPDEQASMKRRSRRSGKPRRGWWWFRVVLFVLSLVPAAAAFLVDRPEEFPLMATLLAPEPAAAVAALDVLEAQPRAMISPTHPGFAFIRRNWPKPLDTTLVGIARSTSYLDVPKNGSAGGMLHSDIQLWAMASESAHDFVSSWSLADARTLATKAVRWRLTMLSGAMVAVGTALSLVLGIHAFIHERD